MSWFKHEKVMVPKDAESMTLCYLGNDGYQAQGTKQYRKLVVQPEFVCKNCGRAAHAAKNLCQPEPVNSEPTP